MGKPRMHTGLRGPTHSNLQLVPRKLCRRSAAGIEVNPLGETQAILTWILVLRKRLFVFHKDGIQHSKPARYRAPRKYDGIVVGIDHVPPGEQTEHSNHGRIGLKKTKIDVVLVEKELRVSL